MIDDVYNIIDSINNLDMIKKLKEIKIKIQNDETSKRLIKNFEEAKELYSKYNISDEFIKRKKELLENELIKEYLYIQNEINYLTTYINNKLNSITKTIL